MTETEKDQTPAGSLADALELAGMSDEELVAELRKDPDQRGDPGSIGHHLSNQQLADLLEKRRGN